MFFMATFILAQTKCEKSIMIAGLFAITSLDRTCAIVKYLRMIAFVQDTAIENGTASKEQTDQLLLIQVM